VRYNTETKRVEFSVAELCLFSGISVDGASKADIAALDEFAAANDEYSKNKTIRKSFNLLAKDLTMSGHFDGYCEERDGIRIDLVRSVNAKAFAKAPKDDLFTYIKCCAWIACQIESTESIFVRIVLKNNESGEYKTHEKKFYFSQLDILVKTLVSGIMTRINHVIRHETYVRPSANGIPFPYAEIRDGQDEMMRGVASAIKNKRRMFAQAPTGIGKTISALYPAVRAFGKGQ
jgi:hypothetical protein